MRSGQYSTARFSSSTEGGFTLVEMLVAIVILSIIMVLAVLTIPNHDDRYWRDNLDQLVSSLNMAQEESVLSGTTMLVQIDSLGWRFVLSLTAGSTNPLVGLGVSSSNGTINTSGLMPDVYRPQLWYKPVVIEPTQLSLGGEVITQALQIPISQEQRRAILVRTSNGHFQWLTGKS